MKNLECINIYKAAFGSSEPFDTHLFEGFSDFIETKEIDGATVSMLFKIPCILNFKGKNTPIYYIYAAATDNQYRGKGYMSDLIKNVIKTTNAPLFLKPATKELEGFYERLGFKRIDAVIKNPDAVILPNEKWEQLSERDSNSQEFTLMYSGYLPPQITTLSFSYTMD